MDTDYDRLLTRLKAARCPYKLYPARIRALEIVTGQSLLAQVTEIITERVGVAAGNEAWRRQFERDLATYGLLEAVCYFHSYPPLAPEFVEDACRLYERLASLYLTRHDAIVSSDDPRVAVQLGILRRFGDSREHITPRNNRLGREAPNGIAPARKPESIARYERRLPVHPDVLHFGSTLGMNVNEGIHNFPDELIDHVAASFTFEGFPGIQAAFFGVADTLDDHGVDVFASDGQYILTKLVGYLHDEMFGDFERWIPCAACGGDFMVDASVESVNDSLVAGGWRCDRCRQ